MGVYFIIVHINVFLNFVNVYFILKDKRKKLI